MVESELLTVGSDGYRFSPQTAELERAVDGLAESYAKYRVVVVGLIFSKPSERVTVFSDAFRIRRRKG